MLYALTTRAVCSHAGSKLKSVIEHSAWTKARHPSNTPSTIFRDCLKYHTIQCGNCRNSERNAQPFPCLEGPPHFFCIMIVTKTRRYLHLAAACYLNSACEWNPDPILANTETFACASWSWITGSHDFFPPNGHRSHYRATIIRFRDT